MRTLADPAGPLAGAFVAEAAASRTRAPIRLLDHDARGWPLLGRERDQLVLDEYGDLWWCRVVSKSDARVVRPCWPEERAGLADAIVEAVGSLRARLA